MTIFKVGTRIPLAFGMNVLCRIRPWSDDRKVNSACAVQPWGVPTRSPQNDTDKIKWNLNKIKIFPHEKQLYYVDVVLQSIQHI